MRTRAIVGACALIATLTFGPPTATALAQQARFVAPVSADVIRAFDPPSHEFGAGHRGLDYGVTSGSRVRASASGLISFAGSIADDGYFVTIDHGDVIETTYSFLSRVDVKTGDSVGQGDVIALSGGGHEGGPDLLHFGAKQDGVYIDPALLLGNLDDITDLLSLTPHKRLAQSNRDPGSEAAEVREVDFLPGVGMGPGDSLFGSVRPNQGIELPADSAAAGVPLNPFAGVELRPPVDSPPRVPAPSFPVLAGSGLAQILAGFSEDLRAGNFKPSGLSVEDIHFGRVSSAQLVDWWKSLSAEEKRAADPRGVGQREDLPSWLRDEANRLALEMEIDELKAMEQVALSDLEALKNRKRESFGRQGNMKLYVVPLLKEKERRALIQKRLKAARHLREVLEAVDDSPRDAIEAADVFLLDYDTGFADGDGRAVVALEDPHSADFIGVFVPGVGNWLGNYWATLDKARQVALTVYRRRGADFADRLSTIAWLGYDTPQSVFDAMGPGEAVNGAPRLEAFVNNLLPGAAARNGGGRNRPLVTVVGHSYGSSTSALAARNGMKVDNLGLIASPGAMASDARYLSGAAKVWVARAWDDPIAGAPPFALLGDDPTGSHFGALEIPVCCEPLGHGKYFSAGTRSLENISRIVIGKYDEVR